jgi:hypothetical protein
MTDLRAAYQQLAPPWTQEQLADHYREAKRHAQSTPEFDEDSLIGPVAMLTTAVPARATLNVAIHVIHIPPATEDSGLADQLLDNAETSAAVALHGVIKRSSSTAEHTTTAQTSGCRPSTTSPQRCYRRHATTVNPRRSCNKLRTRSAGYRARSSTSTKTTTTPPRRSQTAWGTHSRCTSSPTSPATPSPKPTVSSVPHG